ncbi:MAG: sulfotransferase domain-containing protein [Opitutales bacterium]
MKPDFICIGAQKAGTSWLYSNLNAQPEFDLPPIKELHYFDRSRKYPTINTLSESRASERLKNPKYVEDAERKLARCQNESEASWWRKYYFEDYGNEWYKSLYSMRKGITGDITPSYSVIDSDDITEMRAINPELKILMLLRNPIERAWSSFRFSHKRSMEAFDLYDFSVFHKFVSSSHQMLRSDYRRTLAEFSRVFDPARIMIVFYDAISETPELLLNQVLEFLGAGAVSSRKDLETVVNKTNFVEMPEPYLELLKRVYAGDIEFYHEALGSYASDWLLSCKPSDSTQLESHRWAAKTLNATNFLCNGSRL